MSSAAPPTPTTATAATGDVALTVFSDAEARAVEALADQIIPGDADNPGATRAGVVYYIDRAVAGFSTDLYRAYRLGLRELDVLCRGRHGSPFADLDTDDQHAIITEFLGEPVGDPASGLMFSQDDQSQGDSSAPDPGVEGRLIHRLLQIVREHTVEGFFCDPVYGGNRDLVGWRLVGFPGAQWGYTAEQMAGGFDATTIPIATLSDLRSQLRTLPPNETYTRGGQETVR